MQIINGLGNNSRHTSFSIAWSVKHHFDWDDNLRSLLLFKFYRGSNAIQKANLSTTCKEKPLQLKRRRKNGCSPQRG
ncbi:hypothetical protein Y032_0001g248 [Ancylostoma ceylanicum]|uniref:Uncharacterized protein n=1 Tax=Ancylostoma ceylanicum TaxID=53326 RepID=A0A016W549_9BILA|nr:hypothetical protein Y032_0001g248 [Ancylostoma ceylanicum]